ncbi:hypothetical protein EC957_004154 [Mortierella hygrophila]|uniref:Uncharacterized protein n=1 Tax=Mortierella hygrophila TaxID=979708 RepID=A0A9P6K956_9FUNG|nr:hypothetical protein EC957_004154 [Mortierella hygrophila]
MLMLNISSAAKLATLAMATFMLASSTSAAPVLNLHGGVDPLPAIDCVKIQSDITRENVSLVQGEQIPIKIDVTGCHPSLVDIAQPWIVTLVNCENHDNTLKLADIIGGADQKEYTLAVNTQPSTLAALNTGSIPSTKPSSTKYHIQVDAISKDGTERLTGRTASFNIAATSFFQRRDDDIVPPVDGPETASPVDGASIPEVVGADKVEDLSPAAAAPPPATAPTVAATPSPSPSPAPAVIPNPTYPNTPPETIDLSTAVTPSGPNQAAPGDPAAPKVIQEPKKGPSSAEVFFKYAGAGSAILSTIGLGVGGLVGGIVGGTVGLVIGISAALVNSLYYAPNVA